MSAASTALPEATGSLPLNYSGGAPHICICRTPRSKISGPNVVVTGPVADQAQLKTIAMPGVLNFRQAAGG